MDEFNNNVNNEPNAFNAQPYQAPAPQGEPGKGFAITSLVTGIVSFFCFGIILGILAIVFGGVAKSKGYQGGMATAGMILGIVGIAIYIVTLITCGGLGLIGELM